MVNQSELAFRLPRASPALASPTPMLHSTRFAADEAYRLENFDEHTSDRPLVAQLRRRSCDAAARRALRPGSLRRR